MEWSFKLFALMNLAWDYIDTVCDVCITMRLEPTKALVRKIRECRKEYDRFRQRVMTSKMEENETDHGLRFEARFKDDFRKLSYGLEHEIGKLDLVADHRHLVLAVQQALTVMDAVKIYARWCDKQIASFDVWVCDCCMVQTEFLKLYSLVPMFAGDCYQPALSARKMTAGILSNRLIQVPLRDLLDDTEYLQLMCKSHRNIQ